IKRKFKIKNTTGYSLNALTDYEVSDTQAYYWLIDADTGKLLIHDSRYIKNQDADKDNIADIMNDFLEAIPGKYNCM
ncbi:MAG TPA: hypothetical protein VHP30_10025, partial [Ignavibacteriales bacterium]|nr:hypothetical protein [Ignavibacteriales bacterium]